MRVAGSPWRHASEQMLDDRSGDVARRRFLQAAPSGDPVHLDYVYRAVTRGQEIDAGVVRAYRLGGGQDRKSTRLNSSHLVISYAVFCLKKKRWPPAPPCRSPSWPTAAHA